MSITIEQVWHVFHAPLLQFIRARVADEGNAEDILQEVFLKIHQHIETLKDVKKLESWVYQITRHARIDYYRSKEQPAASLATAEALDLAELGTIPLAAALASLGCGNPTALHE
jgi:RNA polymerase sigma-70 factor (ECF subfamily)